jgi:hypothetical protein
MDKEQATAIQSHALKTQQSLAGLEEIISALPAEERAVFAEYLGDLSLALGFGILSAIYERFPELRPPQEPAAISGYLEWANVKLPDGILAADLDSAILISVKRKSLKTARIITDTASALKSRGVQVEFEIIAARIKALVDEGRIDAQGDVRMWRDSEVRLPPSC